MTNRWLFGLILIIPAIALADVKLPAFFSDNMVLQRDTKVPIWGWAEPGERITATFKDQSVSAKADKDGKWSIKFSPMPTGGPFTMTVAGKNTIVIKNVVIGEVWLCSGQSNMAMVLGQKIGGSINNAKEEIVNANYPMIRMFHANNGAAETPCVDMGGQWQICNSNSAILWSATAYFFGRKLYQELQMPIGLIVSARGATRIELWASRDVLESDPDGQLVFKHLQQKQLSDFSIAKEKYEKDLTEWKKNAEAAKVNGAQISDKPSAPWDPTQNIMPAGFFNSIIYPLSPYAIKGVIWYQGEGNIYHAYHYRKQFPALIRDWRKLWGQGDFPFLFVQLPNYTAKQIQPGNSFYAELREAQLMALSVTNTAMAVTIDTDKTEPAQLHSGNKQDVGQRLALAALGMVYGKNIIYSGPIYESMSIEGNKIRLKFKHGGDGLMVKDADSPKGFTIAGEDRQFVWAEAKIDGDSILVLNEKVSKPVAVRYAWAENPIANLYNKSDLPASPFRTDDWPGITVNAK